MSILATATVTVALTASLAWLFRPPPRPASQPGRVLEGGVLVAYSPAYRVSFFGLERLHPFDIAKYDRIADGLVDAGVLTQTDFAMAEPVGDAALAMVHDPDYLASLHHPGPLSQALEVHLPDLLTTQAIERRVLAPFQAAVGGTLLAARAARDHGMGINLGGGYHHARPALGHGFCIYSDVALAVSTLRTEGLTGPVLIVDTDAHQGDGSHAFFANDPTVFSFSMHQGNIFPSPKLPGDRDLPLPAGTDDQRFLAALDQELQRLIDEVKPVLIIHVAGADVLSDDPLAGLSLTPDGMVARDTMVAKTALTNDISLLHLLAGGYGPSAATAQLRAVKELVSVAQNQ